MPVFATRAAAKSPAHLSARPVAHAPLPARAGVQPLGLGGARDGVLFVPRSYRPDRPAPLLVMLHGAGAAGRPALDLVESEAERRGVLVLAPDSRGSDWDVIVGDLGPDVGFLDRALAFVFSRYTVDPARVAIAGFSDGASYALTLGLANGDLFSAILALSPGFEAAPSHVGHPRVFVSHGTKDPVLRIGRTSRVLVPELTEQGYQVRYHEFDGGHWPPPEDVRDAFRFWLGTSD